MKRLSLFLVAMLLFGCSGDTGNPCADVGPVEPEVAHWNTNPTHKLKVVVRGINNSEAIDIAYLSRRLNSIFFNKVKIDILLRVENRFYTNQSLSPTNWFNVLPNSDYHTIYIVDDNKFHAKGSAKGKKIIVKRSFIYTSTTPHEIGHSLSLPHFNGGDWQNIMKNVESDCGKRVRWTDEQVRRMKKQIEITNYYQQ